MLRVVASAAFAAAMVLGQPLAFEAASVKPTDPNARVPLDFRASPGGRLVVTNWTLELILREAYGVRHYQVSGGPSWLTSDHFDITAKAEGDPSREQMMLMLQTLLADRFKLKVHRETREGAVYALVVAKNGSKLQEVKELKDGDRAGVFTYRTGSPVEPAVSYIRTGRKASMPLLVQTLADMVARPVLDQTGIKGEFDFRLEYAADDSHLDAFPSLFTAIQEQLGLKLEAQKGPMETLVIDHVEKPSDN
jgi:uncharacterized protein (TIGR03435 family)